VTKNELGRATRVIGTLFVVLSLHTAEAAGQGRFDVALLLGSTGATDAGPTLQFDRGKTYQATFAWRVWERDAVALAVEVPFITSPAFNVVRADRPTYAYASLYLTPGVRVAAFPRRTVSVFGAVGGGYALYTEGQTRIDGAPNPQPRDTNTDAIQFGGGVDVRALQWLAFRGEVRDINTGARQFSIPTPHERVHNVIVSVGFLVGF
jgi:hypothetical protein